MKDKKWKWMPEVKQNQVSCAYPDRGGSYEALLSRSSVGVQMVQMVQMKEAQSLVIMKNGWLRPKLITCRCWKYKDTWA
jgi:hypothetical protein